MDNVIPRYEVVSGFGDQLQVLDRLQDLDKAHAAVRRLRSPTRLVRVVDPLTGLTVLDRLFASGAVAA